MIMCHIEEEKNCTQMRSLVSAGTAIYQETIASRDVKLLKQVISD